MVLEHPWINYLQSLERELDCYGREFRPLLYLIRPGSQSLGPASSICTFCYKCAIFVANDTDEWSPPKLSEARAEINARKVGITVAAMYFSQ